MINRDQALAMVVAEAAALASSLDDELVILPDGIEEFPSGWLVFMQTRKYAETNDPDAMILGLGPFWIDRKSETLHALGSSPHWSVQLKALAPEVDVQTIRR